MNPSERLKQLKSQIIAGSVAAEDVARELRDLLHVFDSVSGAAPYREKIRIAITWAEIYASPRRTGRLGQNRYGGADQVRHFLLQDVTAAADIAERLQNADR